MKSKSGDLNMDRKIHKSKGTLMFCQYPYMIPGWHYISRYWKDVTCKKCLEKKNEK